MGIELTRTSAAEVAEEVCDELVHFLLRAGVPDVNAIDVLDPGVPQEPLTTFVVRAAPLVVGSIDLDHSGISAIRDQEIRLEDVIADLHCSEWHDAQRVVVGKHLLPGSQRVIDPPLPLVGEVETISLGVRRTDSDLTSMVRRACGA